MQANLAELEVVGPTPVQAAAIPVLLRGVNAAVQSYTGSGKACMLPCWAWGVLNVTGHAVRLVLCL